MSETNQKNTITTTASNLILVKIDRGTWTADQGSHEHSEGWANSAYYAVSDSVLAVDYEAGGGAIGLLVLVVDQEETLSKLSARGFAATAAPLEPQQGKSRFGDGLAGTVDVWRDGCEILLVEGSQPLGWGVRPKAGSRVLSDLDR